MPPIVGTLPATSYDWRQLDVEVADRDATRQLNP